MIELKNLTKIYAREKVVDGISLTVPKGVVFGFLGANGAGKTTTMKMAVGITRPASGEARIEGRSVFEKDVREHIGFMPEAPYFYERLTGLEFLIFCSALFKKTTIHLNNRLETLLHTVGLFDARHKKISTYSKGMKQRLAFAQALVNNPRYLFLDEPLDGLDPIGRREIKQMIQKLRKEGKTIFFNSHILYDIEELCDMIGVIHKGKMLYQGGVLEFTKGATLENKFVELVTARARS